MRDHVAMERRRAALAELIAAYEAEHGEITDQELADQARADRDPAAALRAIIRERLARVDAGEPTVSLSEVIAEIYESAD